MPSRRAQHELGSPLIGWKSAAATEMATGANCPAPCRAVVRFATIVAFTGTVFAGCGPYGSPGAGEGGGIAGVFGKFNCIRKILVMKSGAPGGGFSIGIVSTSNA